MENPDVTKKRINVSIHPNQTQKIHAGEALQELRSFRAYSNGTTEAGGW